MKKKCLHDAAAAMFCVFTLCFFEVSRAQLAYSTFTESAVAYAALAGLGINFSAANPAILGTLPPDKRFAYTLDANEKNVEITFKDKFPDYCLQLAVTSRLTIAFTQTERQAFTTAVAFQRGVDHPLGGLTFSYLEDWSVGVGYSIKPTLSAGLAMRHEAYAVTPMRLAPFSFWQQFRTFDLGIRKAGARFNFGIIFRNLIKNRTTEPFNQPVLIQIANSDSVIAWNPASFPGIAAEPAFRMECGAQWLISSHWQLLADLSSRREYALGLRWRVLSTFFMTTGTGKRFDRIYDSEAVTYSSLGGQFQHKSFVLGLTWIIPTRSGRTSLVQLPYGSYHLRQETRHQLLIGFALSF